VRCYSALMKCNQLGQTTIYNRESERLIVVGQMLALDSQYQTFSCERRNTQSELSSYLIISTMMMITGSRMISPTSTATTAAIVMDPPPDTKMTLCYKTHILFSKFFLVFTVKNSISPVVSD